MGRTGKRLAGIGLLVGLVASILGVTSNNAGALTPVELGIGNFTDWGYGQDTAALHRGVTNLRDLGAKWVRSDMATWAWVNPTPGVWRWDAMDKKLSDLKRNGIKVLIIVNGTPDYAQRPEASGNYHSPPRADQLDGWSEFNRRLADRYMQPGHVMIDAVEVWNEPNHQAFWNTEKDPALYVNLLRRTHDAVKDVNPDIPIVLAGPAPAPDRTYDNGPDDHYRQSIHPRTWLKDVYAAGGKPYFDAVGAHPYNGTLLPTTDPERSGWGALDIDMPNITDKIKTTDSFRTTMGKNGDSGKKIWVTEAGSSVNDFSGTTAEREQKQAQMAKAYIDSWATKSYAGPFMYFRYKDDNNPADVGGNDKGILRNDFTKRPSYYSLKDAVLRSRSTPSTTRSTTTTTRATTTTTRATTTTTRATTTTTRATTTTTRATTTTTRATTTTRPTTTLPVVTDKSILVNLGGPTVTNTGVNWLDDWDGCVPGYCSHGITFDNANGWVSTPATSKIDQVFNSAVRGTAGQPLNIHIPAQPGDYQLVLFFKEIEGKSTGQRVFDIAFEGWTHPQIRNYDIAKAGGVGKTVVVTVNGSTADGNIDLQLNPSVGTPILNGVVVNPR